MSIFAVDDDKCNFCGLCAVECPAAIIVIKGPEALPFMPRGGEKFCIDCGHCVAVCPPGAISLENVKPEDCTKVSKELLPTPEQVEHFLKSRRSVRAFKEEPVPRNTLAKIIDIARYAPSGRNLQPVQWLVVEDSNEVKRLTELVIDWIRLAAKESPLPVDLIVAAWESGVDTIMHHAPHAILAHSARELPSVQGDGLIGLTYLELAAYSLGVGACWAHFFGLAATSYPPMREALQFPDGHQCLGAMMIGYPKNKFSRIPLRNEPNIIWH